MDPKILVGPVLSYRDIRRKGNTVTWCVSALVGFPAGQTPVRLVADDKPCEPMLLANTGTADLWRYDLSVKLVAKERRIRYHLEGLQHSWEFTVPSRDMDVRCAYVSCNGFSDPRAMRGLKHKAGAVWEDLVRNHDQTLYERAPVDKEQMWHIKRGHGTAVQRFHVLMMGGDQIYFDSIWEDIDELKEWADMGREQQLKYPVSGQLRAKIEAYYFSKYCERWLKPARGGWCSDTQERDCADAMARIPTVMMWDDHDIYDGWGSYSPEMQGSAVPQAIFAAARRAFWVYQMQHPLELLPQLRLDQERQVLDAPQFDSINWSTALKNDPLALPLLDDQPGFSSVFELGSVRALVLDLRTERSRNQIISDRTWDALEKVLFNLPDQKSTAARVTHVLLLSSVPLAHPKLSAAEALLDTFGSEHVVESSADDLKDHWSHDDHEPQRKRLTRLLVKIAQDKRTRVCVVSGDVHVAAWGNLYRGDATPDRNWLRIQQFTSSAVLHPAPSGPIEGLFVKFLNSAAANIQQIDTEHRCEMMLFPAHNKYMMASRNWLALEPDSSSNGAAPRLWASWRCEQSEGFSNHLLAVHPAPVE